LWVQRDPYVTTSQIAERLGTTKDTVAGRAFRLKLPNRTAFMPRPETHADRYGEQIRAAEARGLSQRMIADEIGIPRQRVAFVCSVLNIRVDPAANRYAVAQSNRRRAGEKRAKRKPNPFLTPAQQANVAKQSGGSWHMQRMRAVPPPTPEEAARLIAEHIAKHGISRCPPAEEIAAPLNSGVGWR
jgi:ribosome-binding protein aMBF1 (putative translation factor)